MRAVILDLGNVVLNWGVEDILDSLDLPEAVRGWLREELFHHRDWLDLDHGITTERDVVAAVCERSPLARSDVEATLTAARQYLQPLPETVALMHEIEAAGLPMYCLSNMSREFYAHIRDYAFFGLFSGIVISGHERCMKPDRSIFRLILERFALDAGATLFVDDSPANIEAARDLGLHAFHFKRSPDCYAALRRMLL